MKKRFLAALLALVMVCALLPTTALAEDSDFVIDENGVLTKYRGSGGDVVIPNNVTAIGDHAFSDRVLTSVTIPLSVTSIGMGAFMNSTITNVTIPMSVTSIGIAAFMDCTRLTSVTISDGVTSIGYNAFRFCPNLTSIDVADDNAYYCSRDGVLFNEDRTELIRCPAKKSGVYKIPDSVTSIEGGAFEDCTGLTGVTIPGSVTSIGGNAFLGCTGLTGVTIPGSVTSIGGHTFYGCTGLTGVTIPGSVTTIGDSAFSNCPNLTSIDVADDNANYCARDGVLFDKERTKLLCFPGGKTGAYIIPMSVTTIEYGAFTGCKGLTSLTILAGVTTIDDTFGYSTSLASIEVTAGNANYSSQDGVLLNRDKTRLIRCPQGKTGGCNVPDSVTSIENCAFYGCAGLTSVDIPDSVTYIASLVFFDCKSLTSVTIPDSVISIGPGVFDFCPDVIVYGKAGSKAERYCTENDIPFVDGIAPGTARAGRLESDNGESVSWSITQAGEVAIDVTAADLAPEEAVLVACYDNDGRFTGVKVLDAQTASAQLDPTTPNVKIFWLGAGAKPQSPSVTVWGK